MADGVNQNVHVDSGGNAFWLFLVLAIVLVFMAVMFRGLPTPQQPPPSPAPGVVPTGWEIVKDRDGRVVGIKPTLRA